MAWFRMMGVDSVEYHRRTVLGRADDFEGGALAYYGSRGETPLEWGGRLADRLGLVGPVDDATYEAIFGRGGARDPHLGTRLVNTRRPGVELVVAAHKSVAVLGLIGRADDMHAILDAESDTTLAFLDEWFSRQGGRRGKSQHRTATSGLLWARTRHATSRAGDPSPHDHVLIANVTEMLDAKGGWKALDSASVRDLTHAATMAGRLDAAAKAVELGYAIEPDRGPSGKLDHWAIAGIPAVVTDLFSKRATEISAAMEAEGFTSRRARGIAARRTRKGKSDESPESLIHRWLDELDSIGWPARKVTQRLDHVTRRLHQPARALTDAEVTAAASSLLLGDGPLANRKAFTRADVIRVAAPLLYGRDPADLDRVVRAVVHHAEAIPLVGQPFARGRAWAAASVLATEVAVEAVGERFAERTHQAAVTPDVVTAAIADRERRLGACLTTGQQRAITAVTTSGRALDLVVGVAGSGKTTALDLAREILEGQGYRVLGTAISGQATRTLRDEAGVDSRTVASLVWRLEHGALRLDDHTVLLVDEAGTADDPAMLKLLAAADGAGAKAVIVGDYRQLDAVGAGGGLEALVRRQHPAVTVLDENVRQHRADERRALEQLRSGKVADAIAWYEDAGRIATAPTRLDALERAVDAWDTDRRSGVDSCLLAWRRRDVTALNQLARERCISAGEVFSPEVSVPGGKPFALGDRVVTLAPSGDGRYVTSDRGTVSGVDREILTVHFDDGRTVTLAGEELAADRLDYAYAVTVHRMQGATADRAHVFADGGGRELAYVAMSRARESSHVYVVADDPSQAVDDLTREWGVERRERWVLDTDQPAQEGDVRRPNLARRTSWALRQAQLRAEEDAVRAVAPWAEHRLRALETQRRLDALEQPPGPSRGLGLAGPAR
ncbi:MobF family relaxase [Rhabdothermincola sediminis]|uniref:MobF family relaxase n=1 Tax=Rhabdothermincola sediminis TaxID=2751370 RepID=UPI001AA00DB8|nr:MobF family relaxase [Rhabdothermincola sediminis]